MSIKYIADNKYESDDFLTVTWEITRLCNYQCSYCQVFRKEDKGEPNLTKVVEFLNEFGKDKNLKITLFGGEPTLSKDIPWILQSLKNDVDIFTNLSQSVEYYRRLANIKKDLEIIATFHPDKISFKEFYSKVYEISTFAKKINIILMVDSSLDMDYMFMHESILKIGVGVEVLKVVHDNNREQNTTIENKLIDDDRSNNLKIIFEDDSCKYVTHEYVLSRGLNNFKYFKCLGGCRNLFISQDCFIYSCFDYRHQDINKKHISEVSVKSLKETVCILEHCTGDIEVPKKRVLRK